MKPFVYNKGLGLLELHQSTESKIRKSLTRPWWRFWLIFDLISRYIFFKSTSQENRKKKLNHDHDFSLTWEILAVSHTFIWHCLLTNFFLQKS